MKTPVIVAALLFMASTAKAQQDFGLPELHQIKTATLGPCYSCRSEADFQKGYEETALFVSGYSKLRNSPDLLFNGFPGGDDYFQASTAGDDMALVADLGDIALEDVTAQLAFNTRNIFAFKRFSRFTRVASINEGHTYAVLLNKSEIRGLLIFRVDSYVHNQKVSLRYAVKEYQILSVRAQSPGFDWEKKNQ